MEFIKMHSLGNDFIIIPKEITLDGRQIQKLCDRNIGIGCDQLFIIKNEKSDDFDVAVDIFNQDGSRATMCLNGLRCVAGYLFSKAGGTTLKIGVVNTVDKISIYHFEQQGDLIVTTFENAKIISKNGEELVNLGNLHKIIVVSQSDLKENISTNDLTPRAADTSVHPDYNINYVNILKPSTLAITTVERGVGLTLACGSGSAASVFFCVQKGLLPYDTQIEIKNGGSLKSPHEFLQILIANHDKPIIKIAGTYQFVFTGTLF